MSKILYCIDYRYTNEWKVEMGDTEISASDWARGILLSILASVIGGISKLSIRKSWLLVGVQRTNDAANNSVPLLEAANGTNTSRPSRTGEEDEEQEDDDRRHSVWVPYALRYLGMFGMSVLNPICCVLAMNYASPSILAPFSGLTLVWVILGSPYINNEMPTSQQMVSCCFIILGEAIVAVFGDHTNSNGTTVEDVKASYRKPAFLVYFAGLAVYLLMLLYWIRFCESHVLKRFAWGCSGGAITGAQNFLKDALIVLHATPTGQRVPVLFVVFLGLAGGTAFAGLLLLTACMKRYDATYSAATFVGSFVVSASIMAIVHYDTFGELDGILNYVMYPFGMTVLMLGVYGLVRETGEVPLGEHDEESDATRQQQQQQHQDAGGALPNESSDVEGLFRYAEVEEDERGRIITRRLPVPTDTH